ncbi:MAG: sulfatase [Cyclobacteriaceae bacterium]|nr:sulfatase [Cyclobacteriaceae bacterium]
MVYMAMTLVSCIKSNKTKLPPNVLFIAVDDMKPVLGCYGEATTLTPHMDKLADRGTVFLNNHCQQALCGPTRASLLLGMYPDQTRIWDFSRKFRDIHPDVVTLPQHFRNNGYTTIGIGKIFDYRNVDDYEDSLSWSETSFPHTGKDAIQFFDKKNGPLVGHFYQSQLVKQRFAELQPEAEKEGINPVHLLHKHIKPATECLEMPDDAYIDGVFAEKAIIDLIHLSKEDKPFFLAVGFHRPHLPFTAPKKYWDLYERDEIEISAIQTKAENDVDYAYMTSGHLRSYSDEEGNFIYDTLKKGGTLTEEQQLKLIHGYKAAVSYIDAQVGKILDKLKELQLEDNTIIVLWGDHGFHLGDHNMWGKHSNFEQATRAPLIFSVPEQNAYKTTMPTEFVDIYPTLCELSGLELPDHLAGESLVELIQGNQVRQDQYAISQYMRGDKMGYSIRDNRYRYVEWIEEGLHVNPNADMKKVADRQFFDYEKDSLETVNYADSEEYKDVQEKLTQQLHAFYNEIHK